MLDLMKDALREAGNEVPNYPWNIMDSYQAIHVPNLGWIDTLEAKTTSPVVYGDGLANTIFRFKVRGFDTIYEAEVEHNSWDGYSNWYVYEVEAFTETVTKYRRKK